MLPSQTVENYLKTIYLEQSAVGMAPDALVPMGRLSGALGVVPGTATTMMKTLAESGLVHYEPYMGVRLTPAGEKLAGLVLRRHRLIELFLVEVLGMNWSEVHDEAEQLEHAVSERLVERIDDMLGRPQVDPHGDPIPTAEGTIARPRYLNLATADLGTPLVVARVIDQDPSFLTFVEAHELMPGRAVTIEVRDPASDSVEVVTDSGRRTTLGMRAASKLLVEAAGGHRD
ncbi:MAG: metal-dependent transcriptional regulator [Vicinamibacterales bacterium]